VTFTTLLTYHSIQHWRIEKKIWNLWLYFYSSTFPILVETINSEETEYPQQSCSTGERNTLMLHGACPVAFGSNLEAIRLNRVINFTIKVKFIYNFWKRILNHKHFIAVANKQIRRNEHMFMKPCGKLDHDPSFLNSCN